MELKYIVTGTGRSGTVYMARLLSSLGLPCGHEAVFDWHGLEKANRRISGIEKPVLSHTSTFRWDGSKNVPLEEWCSGEMVADSSYLAAPFLKEFSCSVIHVVRDPVKVIQSFCNYIGYFKSETPSNQFESFIYDHVPELKGKMPVYDRACLHWIRWNQMIESNFLHRVEDGPDSIMKFLGAIGEPFMDNTVNSYRRHTKERFSIDKISSKEIRDEFIALGRKYGYKMRLENLML